MNHTHEQVHDYELKFEKLKNILETKEMTLSDLRTKLAHSEDIINN